MRHIKGNSYDETFFLQDKEGDPIDLAGNSDIIFVIKDELTKPDSEAIVIGKETTGEVTIQDLVNAEIRVQIDAVDMDIPVGDYYMALEVQYVDGRIWELFIFQNDIEDNGFRIVQDGVHD